jgi:uncharacterized membrane protein
MTAPGPASYNPFAALAEGWDHLRSRPGPFGLVALGMLVVGLAVAAGAVTMTATWLVSDAVYHVDPATGVVTLNPGGSLFATWVVPAALVPLVAGVPLQFLLAGLTRGGLDLYAGRPVTVAGMFRGWNRGHVLVCALLVALATGLGTLLCSVPGLIVGFLTSYATLFVVDAGLAPVPAIRASVAFTLGNLGPTLLYWLLAAVTLTAGAAVCLVGLLVAIPVAVLGQVRTYQRLITDPE